MNGKKENWNREKKSIALDEWGETEKERMNEWREKESHAKKVSVTQAKSKSNVINQTLKDFDLRNSEINEKEARAPLMKIRLE